MKIHGIHVVQGGQDKSYKWYKNFLTHPCICQTKLNQFFMPYFFPNPKGLRSMDKNLQPTAAKEVHFIYFLKN